MVRLGRWHRFRFANGAGNLIRSHSQTTEQLFGSHLEPSRPHNFRNFCCRKHIKFCQKIACPKFVRILRLPSVCTSFAPCVPQCVQNCRVATSHCHTSFFGVHRLGGHWHTPRLTITRECHCANLRLLMARIFEEWICCAAERSQIAGCTMPIGVIETQRRSESAVWCWSG